GSLASGSGTSPGAMSTVMMGEPTSTVTPSSASRAVTTPSKGQGSSTMALAVSISTMVWLTSTVSPGCTCHLTISASVSPAPPSGGLTCFRSGIGSPAEGSVDGIQDAIEVGQIVVLQPGGRIGGGEPADPQHRSLQGVEALLGDPGGQFGPVAVEDR